MLLMTMVRDWGKKAGPRGKLKKENDTTPTRLPERPDGKWVLRQIEKHTNPKKDDEDGPSIIAQAEEMLVKDGLSDMSLIAIERNLVKAFGKLRGKKEREKKGWRLEYESELREAKEKADEVFDRYRRDKTNKELQEERREARDERRRVVMRVVNAYYTELCGEIQDLAENRPGVEFFDAIKNTSRKLSIESRRGHGFPTRRDTETGRLL